MGERGFFPLFLLSSFSCKTLFASPHWNGQLAARPALSHFSWLEIRRSANFMKFGNVVRRILKLQSCEKGRSGDFLELTLPGLHCRGLNPRSLSEFFTAFEAVTNRTHVNQLEREKSAQKLFAHFFSTELSSHLEPSRIRNILPVIFFFLVFRK